MYVLPLFSLSVGPYAKVVRGVLQARHLKVGRWTVASWQLLSLANERQIAERSVSELYWSGNVTGERTGLCHLRWPVKERYEMRLLTGTHNTLNAGLPTFACLC